MKQAFIECNFRKERMDQIAKANQIIASYNTKLTLRQLYYQFVVRNWLPNTERSYKNLGETISQGRLAGLIDWNAIEDRIRVPFTQSEWKDLKGLVESAARSYRLPRWMGQKYYVELWVEKSALAGVLEPMAEEFHITLMVNRGYSSQSAMYDAAQRFEYRGTGKRCILLYLGDHDPSGEDMVRDVQDRLDRFGATVQVQKVALTMAQVQQYSLPPNPAKMSDSRAQAYVAEHGASSWEVDALPPNVLQALVRAAVVSYLDQSKMDAIKEREKIDIVALRRAAANIVRRNGDIEEEENGE